MRRILLAASVCITALAFSAAPAVADGGGVQTADPACHGQTVSGFVEGVGVAKVAAAFGLTVQQAQDNVSTFFCSGGNGGMPNADACHGQNVSGFVEGVGLPEVAAAFGLTVQQAQDVIDTVLCPGV